MVPPNDRQSDRQQGETLNNEVPSVMMQQATAAIAGENDRFNTSDAERRHMGRDVPVQHTDPLEPGHSEYDVPPPAYGEHYGVVEQEQEGFGTKASVADDGRVNIRIDQRNRRLSQLLVPSLKQLQAAADQQHAPPPPYIPPFLGGKEGQAPPPPMNVVIQVVGSRGDVQPFVALGKVLKETYGHRVRLATHPNFKDFVTENGLEFFSIGGDPQALMAFMVKNPGLMPGFDSLRTGDVGKRRKEVGEYLQGCWRSCFESGNGFGPEAKNDTFEDWNSHASSEHDYIHRPFVADCIIANPPSFAHIHCAEKMGIPLHIMFTMPWSPTQAFPHPLADIQSSNADANLTNYVTYALVDMLTWQGLGDVINRFRQRSLGLDSISLMWAPGMLQKLRIPHTYCWSPALIPKPRDWGANISLSGFFFLDLASNYTPDPDLKAFLDAGPPPVYIGFGSIVLDNPTAMTKLIFDAVEQTGQRALVSKGWGGVGADELGKPDNVYMLGNVPHDWLFKQVSCVVHHGGAGTTAAGITAGRPTLVVPFFGDQQFWGSMVARAGAGPAPIPNKQLTSENLAAGILKCLQSESQERAREMAASIATEKGSHVGAQSFHQYLDVDKLRCSLAPSRAAVWRIKRTQARLSAMAACTLAQEGLLDFNDLKLFRSREYEADEGPWDPITGASTALIGTMSTMMLGVADFPIETLKALGIHPDAKAKRESKKEGKNSVGSERQDSLSGSVKSGHTGKQSDGIASTASGASTPSETMTPRSTTSTSITSDAPSRPEARATSSFNFQESLAKLNAGPLSSGSQTSAGSRPRSPQRSGSSLKDIDWRSQFSTGADTAKGMQRIVGAGLKSPLDFTMGLAKGFHNAPKLYGDDTVRKTENVTDFKSGVRVATKEFGLGMYDGITGLVTQPFKGAMKEGPAGFMKGIGKGIGGVMLKPQAAVFAIPGYTMKGIYKEIQSQSGSSVQNYIIAARTAQGFDEYQSASPEERRDVVMRWGVLQKNLKRKRNADEMVRDILKEQMDKKEKWLDARRIAKDANSLSQTSSNVGRRDPEESMLAIGTDHASAAESYAAEDRAIEEAIRLSVLETSQGDPTEDARVAQGIRGKLAGVQRHRPVENDPSEDAALRQAIEASTADAHRSQQERSQYDRELEQVIAQSLKEQRGWTDSDSEAGGYSSAYSEHTLAPADQPPAYDPGHLEGTTQQEFEGDTKHRPNEKTQQEKTEEQIVMEYIKKQSILEQKAKAPQTPDNDEDDEELQRALKASMQGYAQHGEASRS